MNTMQDISQANRTPLAKTVMVDKDGKGFIQILWGGVSVTPSTIRSEDAAFDRALDAYKESKWDELYKLMNPKMDFLVTYQKDDVAIVNGQVCYKGVVIHSALTKRIVLCLEQGIPCDHLFTFMNNLMLNPSEDSRNELYDFLEGAGIPITDQGTFIAYKGVQADYWSISSGSAKLLTGRTNERGQVYNGIGEVIEMRREDVDDNRRNECSYGLHAGTHEYANGFKGGGKLVLVEINPKDVVSVPKDYNCAKLRTCAYTVIGAADGMIEDVVVRTEGQAVKGVKPTSSGFHNVRDDKGRFAKTQAIAAAGSKPTSAVNKHNVRDQFGRFAKPNVQTTRSRVATAIASGFHNVRDRFGRFTKG